MTDTQLPANLIAFVRDQKDRHEIHECLLRYTRGVDRHDIKLLESAYHDDAFDEHGVVNGNREEFCAWALAYHGGYQRSHHHVITNSVIDLDGDTAHVETYYTFFGDNKAGPATLAYGRYVDRFERRNGEWRIAHRVCVSEYAGVFSEQEMPPEARMAMLSTGPNTRDFNDISYDRPLRRSRGPAPSSV